MATVPKFKASLGIFPFQRHAIALQPNWLATLGVFK